MSDFLIVFLCILLMFQGCSQTCKDTNTLAQCVGAIAKDVKKGYNQK